MQALNLSNQENMSPYQGFIPPTFLSPHTQFHGYCNHFPQCSEQSSEETSSQNNMFGANQTVDNLMMMQLLQQMKVMQHQISGLVLTNKRLSQFGAKLPSTDQFGQNKDLNPRTGLPWKRYRWSCGYYPHWVKKSQIKVKFIKMTHHSKK